MARVIPDASEAELAMWDSGAEARVYRLCRSLPESWVILHSVPTLDTDGTRRPRDGETDFVVIDPARGVLVIEVKGHYVSYDPRKDKWSCAQDPFRQAKDRKHDLRRRIESSRLWRDLGGGGVAIGHAVLFPDIEDVEKVTRPDANPRIVGGTNQLEVLAAWIDSVFEFWTGEQESRWKYGAAGANAAEHALAAAFSVMPRLGAQIVAESEMQATWTDRQWEALQGLRHWSRVAVAGGAGTGKTLLAVRRAQELANAGKRTLLLCYNSPLGDLLKLENQRWTARGGDPRDLLHTMTYHELCLWWTGVVGHETARDLLAEARRQYPGYSEYDVQMPVALAWAVEEKRPQYDAIIVDEGQDFGEEYWIALETIAERKIFAIFYDPNQAIFRNASTFPIGEEKTYWLVRNCRSTGQIHKASYRHYDGPPVDPPPHPGSQPRKWLETSAERVPARIAEELQRMIRDERVLPHDIALLIVEAQDRLTAFGALQSELTRLGTTFVEGRHRQPDVVLLETAGRFKGLEASVVVVWFNHIVTLEERRRLVYVALSRPRSLLVIAGTHESCDGVLIDDDLPPDPQ